MPVPDLVEWARDARSEQRALLLLTAHRAKGLEFDDVVILNGGWEPDLRTVDLSWAGRLGMGHASLAAISGAKAGDPILIARDGPTWMMQNLQGQALGRMAKSWSPPDGLRLLRGEVGSIVRWRKSDNEEEYRANLRRDEWEAIVPELVFG